jgi:lysyl endopeptidase
MRRAQKGRLASIVCVVALVAAFVPFWAVQTAAAASLPPVYRFYNAKLGSHFYTISAAERAYVQANFPATYAYEGVAYRALPDVGPTEGVPLYRFYNKKNGSHFYTISAVEKAYVQANFPAIYAYEGVAYNVYADDLTAPVMPVYRFYNKKNGSHFYTISDDEKSYVRLHFPETYVFEGIAFYAWPHNSNL